MQPTLELLIKVKVNSVWQIFYLNNASALRIWNTKITCFTGHIPGVVLDSLLLTLNNFTPCSSVSTVKFEHVIASWDAVSTRYLWTNAQIDILLPFLTNDNNTLQFNPREPAIHKKCYMKITWPSALFLLIAMYDYAN